MVNKLVFRWTQLLFFMTLGAHGNYNCLFGFGFGGPNTKFEIGRVDLFAAKKKQVEQKNCQKNCTVCTLQGTKISHQRKRKLIFPTTHEWDMLVFGRASIFEKNLRCILSPLLSWFQKPPCSELLNVLLQGTSSVRPGPR